MSSVPIKNVTSVQDDQSPLIQQQYPLTLRVDAKNPVESSLSQKSAKTVKQEVKALKPQMPCILIFQQIVKAFAILSGVSCIVQYCLRIVDQARMSNASAFMQFKAYIISAANIIIGILLAVSAALPIFSKAKQYYYKKLYVFNHPLVCGFLMIYITLVFAPHSLFKDDKINMSQSVFMMINFFCCILMVLMGFQANCDQKAALQYYEETNRPLDKDIYQIII